MERLLYKSLLQWKNSANRKPLILFGARQTGKTWLLKEFGRHEYEQMAYISCDNNPEIKRVFSDFDTARLIRSFSAITGVQIQKNNTLIFLDEVQEVPQALTSLKYFCENVPEYHIAVAGSLLGIAEHKGTGFPVGKADEFTLYPLSFEEFLLAMGKDSLLDMIRSHQWQEVSTLRDTCKELLRQYYFTGGMPDVVRNYIASQNLEEVRTIQKRILSDYRNDFSKHVPIEYLPKVNMVWDSVPSQLARENKKFIYSAIRKGARAKDFETAIQWLTDAGLIHKVMRINKIGMPLKFYEDFTAFKLFFNDLGLLGAMSDVPAQSILIGDSFLTEYKGAFTEQYVLQQMLAAGVHPYYYTNERSTLEMDFVLQKNKVYPVEVKAEENLMSKSLRSVVSSGDGLTGWRFSMSDYREQDWMVNVPLYLAGEWIKAAE